MLDHEMAAQLQQYMGMLRRPLTITASLSALMQAKRFKARGVFITGNSLYPLFGLSS